MNGTILCRQISADIFFSTALLFLPRSVLIESDITFNQNIIMTEPIQYSERDSTSLHGLAMIAISFALIALGIYGSIGSFGPSGLHGFMLGISLFIGLSGLVSLTGIYVINPNECALFLFFGDYRGCERAGGMRWTNPFYTVIKANLKTQTFITEKLKVNDERGNPVEIAAAVVWHIKDAAAATFGLQDIKHYLTSAVEASLREIASQHPYDHADQSQPNEITLRAHVSEVSEKLIANLRTRLRDSGGAIEILDIRLTHLAYAPEIASSMLRRQQAEAVISARKKIVQGAVTMVDEALRGLSEKGIALDDERKAAMVGNLLVVLCAEREATPVINAGGL